MALPSAPPPSPLLTLLICWLISLPTPSLRVYTYLTPVSSSPLVLLGGLKEEVISFETEGKEKGGPLHKLCYVFASGWEAVFVPEGSVVIQASGRIRFCT